MHVLAVGLLTDLRHAAHVWYVPPFMADHWLIQGLGTSSDSYTSTFCMCNSVSVYFLYTLHYQSYIIYMRICKHI